MTEDRKFSEPTVVELLVCPKGCLAQLVSSTQASSTGLSCPGCDTFYPVKDGVPVLFADDAQTRLALDESFRNDALQKARHYSKQGTKGKGSSDENAGPLNQSAGKKPRLLEASAWEYLLVETLPYATEHLHEVEQDFDQVFRFVLQREGSLNDKRVLSIGCGYDPLLLLLKREGASCFALDVVLELAEYQSARGVVGVCADAHRLPFREGSFDIVICNASLHHMWPLEQPLAEMARVLKDGGSVHVFDGLITWYAKIWYALPSALKGLVLRLFHPGTRGSPFEHLLDLGQLLNLIKRIEPFCQVDYNTKRYISHRYRPAWLFKLLSRAVPALAPTSSIQLCATKRSYRHLG